MVHIVLSVVRYFGKVRGDQEGLFELVILNFEQSVLILYFSKNFEKHKQIIKLYVSQK
jgi:hypothetical protein